MNHTEVFILVSHLYFICNVLGVRAVSLVFVCVILFVVDFCSANTAPMCCLHAKKKKNRDNNKSQSGLLLGKPVLWEAKRTVVVKPKS